MDLPRPVAGDGAAATSEGGGGRGASERRSAASSTVRGEREGGAARAAAALRLWTSMVGGRTDGSGEGRGALATSDSTGSGKVAARVDCNWFIIINDDLLYGMETVFV